MNVKKTFRIKTVEIIMDDEDEIGDFVLILKAAQYYLMDQELMAKKNSRFSRFLGRDTSELQKNLLALAEKLEA